MIKGIYQSSRTLELKTKNIDSIAGNLANINTTGYKRQIPFSEVLSETGEVKIKQYTDFRQGELVSTGSPLDLAIDGKGYFVVKSDAGNEYTRNGKLKISEEGYIVNEQGKKLVGHNGEINIFEYTTQEDQTIQVLRNGEIKIGKNTVDTLLIVNMEAEQDSVRNSGLNFSSNDFNVTPLDEESYKIHQGYLEESNVNPIIEMESMIRINNEYESAGKMMRYLDNSLGQANEIGKV